MRNAALILVVSLLSLPLQARSAHRFSPLTVSSGPLKATPVDDPAVVARVFQQLRAARDSRASGVHAQSITDIRSSRVFIIPAAGSVAGGGGLFFRSDVTLINYASASQDVFVGWWASGSTNSLNGTSQFVRVTLPPLQAVTTIDFVATTMNQSGLGTLVFIPVVGNSFDFTGAIDGFSRIYTKQPGSEGTVSQPFESVDPDSLSTFDQAVSLGLRQDASFRTNFGIVNVDGLAHVYHVQFIGERAKTDVTVTVPPLGMIQQAIPAGDYGAPDDCLHRDRYRKHHNQLGRLRQQHRQRYRRWLGIGGLSRLYAHRSRSSRIHMMLNATT